MSRCWNDEGFQWFWMLTVDPVDQCLSLTEYGVRSTQYSQDDHYHGLTMPLEFHWLHFGSPPLGINTDEGHSCELEIAVELACIFVHALPTIQALALPCLAVHVLYILGICVPQPRQRWKTKM